jgi:hypothetical protein
MRRARPRRPERRRAALIASHLRSTLVVDALKLALARRRPRARADPPLRPGLAVRQPHLRPRRKAGRDRGLDGLPRRRLRQTPSPRRSSPRSRRSSSTAAAGRRGSSSSRPCSSTSRRSTTAGAATPCSPWSPRLSMSRPRQCRHHQDQTANDLNNPGVVRSGAGPVDLERCCLCVEAVARPGG